MAKLMGDHVLRAEMGIRNRRLVEEKFDWSIVSVMVDEIYNEVIYNLELEEGNA